ncbi:hypothetical protein HK100_000089 [Physocladia obscura]|uniref:Nudix hydrolase domain-containing protein n=1 Tax=Physocladia obscura TaxID=109957 RepID=A0AAD5T8X8_9FUNG|nr:hypothetical protein HK100_000089 [Physocladia obscura]
MTKKIRRPASAPPADNSRRVEIESVSEAQTTLEAVREKARANAAEIKNRGRLNPQFYYFEAKSGEMITNSSVSLSDNALKKYFTVAADMLVFNASLTHVLMIFRCPHNKQDGHKCADNILDESSFQYKGCLATPGGFFDAVHDYDGNTPDFRKSAVRELNEECNNLLDGSQAPSHDAVVYIGSEFNNFRDIRWFTSINYVPTLATQYATALPSCSRLYALEPFTARQRAAAISALPPVKGTDDACGNAYWIDVRIIEFVYNNNKKLFNSFDKEFNEVAFQSFVRSNFLLNSEGLPRNKLKSENKLLHNLPEKKFVVNFEPNQDYQFSDFAFDHVKNIIKAQEVLKTNFFTSRASFNLYNWIPKFKVKKRHVLFYVAAFKYSLIFTD